jgi:hypothetical protein
MSLAHYAKFPGILVIKAPNKNDIIKYKLSDDVVQIIIHPDSIYNIHILLSEIQHHIFKDGYDIMYSKIVDNTYYITIGDKGQKNKDRSVTTQAISTKQSFTNTSYKISYDDIENLVIKYVSKDPAKKVNAVMAMDIKSVTTDEPFHLIFFLSIISILLVLLFALVITK